MVLNGFQCIIRIFCVSLCVLSVYSRVHFNITNLLIHFTPNSTVLVTDFFAKCHALQIHANFFFESSTSHTRITILE